jgi:uncharacterized protein YoxC
MNIELRLKDLKRDLQIISNDVDNINKTNVEDVRTRTNQIMNDIIEKIDEIDFIVYAMEKVGKL